MTTTETPATVAQVRKLHKDQGNDVRISRDGRVEFRDPRVGVWMEGRWVSEYRVDADGKVYLA